MEKDVAKFARKKVECRPGTERTISPSIRSLGEQWLEKSPVWKKGQKVGGKVLCVFPPRRFYCFSHKRTVLGLTFGKNKLLALIKVRLAKAKDKGKGRRMNVWAYIRTGKKFPPFSCIHSYGKGWSVWAKKLIFYLLPKHWRKEALSPPWQANK